MRLIPWLLACTVLAGVCLASADPYQWLEDVDSPRAMAWVRDENAKTTARLESDPRYPAFYASAVAIAQSKDRLPKVTYLAGELYNLWQDADHVHGIWRRAALESYGSPTPAWSTVLDLDALARTEQSNPYLEDVTCVEPSERHCLLSLSDGGEDAVSVREFDLASARFRPHGFSLPRGKQAAAWEDEDTLIVAREWRKGELTTSGYPFIVKRLRRGEDLASALELYRGAVSDQGGVVPMVFADARGHRAVLIERERTTFESDHYAVRGARVEKLAMPEKVEIEALIDDQLVLHLVEDWTVGGATLPRGALVAIDWPRALRNPEHLVPTLIYDPAPRESFQSAATIPAGLLVTTLENVQSRAFLYRPTAAHGWTRARIELPGNATITLEDASIHSNEAILTVTDFLEPTRQWQLDPTAARAHLLKTLPPQFDASGDVVEQFEAASSDGVEIPYFIVHPRSMQADGANPTILHAYGGFLVSMTPAYNATLGKLWLERGGVYVLANIRGGGEFGPRWHEAGLTTHRQIIYDDFVCVARDLIARRITSPGHLGIEGGSNGGLLMGVELTQHPELWNAVDIQIPLLDMERFEQIAAGASWVGEYGSMSKPDEAAFLSSISPYANLRRGVHYPEPFIWTTTKDDRVGPQHARKFAARLSELSVPYAYYEVIEGGHSAGATLEEKARVRALEMIYFTRKLADR